MLLLQTPTPEVQAGILAAANTNEELLRNAGRALKLWLNEQPHLPDDFDEKRLSLMFLQCKNGMEKAKAAVEMYHTLKRRYPEFLTGRDPCQPWFARTTDTVFLLPLPELTDDYCRVLLAGNFHPDISTYFVNDVIKLDFMVLEMLISEEVTPFDIVIIDCANSGAQHFAKYTLPIIRKFATVILDGYKIRLNSFHFLNAPIYVQIVVGLIKLVIKPKLFRRVS
ncbi:hypothetical protein C0J52_01305 [Blattella germanica]|nr:hypothetical protein C0J52_01305 [Blattella germanica]